jgi:hypothetical protein
LLAPSVRLGTPICRYHFSSRLSNVVLLVSDTDGVIGTPHMSSPSLLAVKTYLNSIVSFAQAIIQSSRRKQPRKVARRLRQALLAEDAKVEAKLQKAAEIKALLDAPLLEPGAGALEINSPSLAKLRSGDLPERREIAVLDAVNGEWKVASAIQREVAERAEFDWLNWEGCRQAIAGAVRRLEGARASRAPDRSQRSLTCGAGGSPALTASCVAMRR